MVTASGQLDQREVFPHQQLDRRHILSVEAEPAGDVAGHGCPLGAVVMRAAHLADVVQECGHEQEIRPCHLTGQTPCVHDRLDEVAVHGVPVDGAALRPRAHPRPFGDPALDEADLIQRLPHRDESGTGSQEVTEQFARGCWPRRGEVGNAGEVAQGPRRDRKAGSCRQDRAAQGQCRVVEQSFVPEHHLTVAHEETVTHGRHLWAAGTNAQRACALRLTRRTEGSLERVGDHPAGARDLGQQPIRIAASEQCGHRVVVLAHQPVPAPIGHDMDRITHVEQEISGQIHVATGSLHEPCLGERRQDREVAQPTARLLEIGFQRLGEVPMPGVPGRQRLEEFGQTAAGAASPIVGDGRAGGGDELSIAGNRRQVEQTDGGGEVRLGDGAALGEGADTVVETHLRVPDRIPDTLCQSRDRGVVEHPTVVQEDEIEVTHRPGVGSCLTAHGGQRHPLGPQAGGRRGPVLGEPDPQVLGQRRATANTGSGIGEATQVGKLQALGLEIGHAHSARLPPRRFRTSPRSLRPC